MARKRLSTVGKAWGINDSTLRKQVGKRFPGKLVGHTLHIDDEEEAFRAWLRDHVLSQRMQRRWPTLIEMAYFTLGYREPAQEGADTSTLEYLQQPLEAAFQTICTSADREVQETGAHQARTECEVALSRFVGHRGVSTTLCALFFRLLDTTYGSSVAEMLKQERLLLFAFAVYQQEAQRADDSIFTWRGEGKLALDDTLVQPGQSYEVNVAGQCIAGSAFFDETLGWRLVAPDHSFLPLQPGMRGKLLASGA